MGSIQALRSEALALRAKSDTDLEVSGFMSSVNKSLGGQITRMIDDLQGVINSRTQAYNGLVGQLNQAINGKGGVGDQGVKWAFQVVNTLVAAIGLITNPTNPNVAGIISTITSFITNILQQQAIQENLKSAHYDYEKMVSVLGYSSIDANLNVIAGAPNPDGFNHGGAVFLTSMRDSMMPRYKPKDPNFAINNRGYVGTLRRW